LAFSFDKISFNAECQVFWPTNQRPSTVPSILAAKDEPIFNTLSDWLAISDPACLLPKGFLI
jgi:hypothetical protein